MQPLGYSEGVAWLRQRGGIWRTEAWSIGSDVIAQIGHFETRAKIAGDSEADLKTALVKAINELREKLVESHTDLDG